MWIAAVAVLVAGSLACIPLDVLADEQAQPADQVAPQSTGEFETATPVSPDSGNPSIFYGDKGLQLQTGETDLWLGLRGQFRYNNTATELDTEEDRLTDKSFKVNRARIKGGGTLGAAWFSPYGEYDLVGSKWLDYRATVTVAGWLDIRIGQWKSDFSRERINSSGKQQLVERSISNYWFTLDRQRGFSTSARFGEGTRMDSRIWVQALSGLGLNSATERSKGLLMGRWQWNPDGEELPFSGSDLARRSERASSLAIAYVTGDSPCTRFSSDGCGQLPGFSDGDYDLEQLMLETALHYRGFGWEQELHYKRVRDERTGEVTRLVGGYAQLGSFLNEWWPRVPAPLEVVARFALVDPDTDRGSDISREFTLGANWFFSGHRNKLSVDLSWIEDEFLIDGGSQTRLRLQWEVSI